MAAATINNRWITVLGPVKIEHIFITDNTSNDTTIESLLQRPIAVHISDVNTDLGGTADPASVTFSGKTITLRDPASTRPYMITVYGY